MIKDTILKFASSFNYKIIIPLLALLALLAGLLLYLFGYSAIADALLAGMIALGGIILFFSVLWQFIRREVGVDVIALLSIVGSFLLHEYVAGAIIVLMLSGGKALETFALRRARLSLKQLIERAPTTAHLVKGSTLEDVPVENVQIGMHILVKPGEIIPVDGVVIEGSASVSEATLTGEAMPVAKSVSMLVLSGSMNLDNVLKIEVQKRSTESHYAQIIRLVEEAQKQKAPINRLADRYSIFFTSLTLVLTALTWLISRNAISALAVLVVATPCPLILATPIAIMSGISTAARMGLIVKSGAAIELLGTVDMVVFDKTGTLTLGTPQFLELICQHGQEIFTCDAQEEQRLLGFAASLEQLSTHILARSIVQAAQERKIPLLVVHDFHEVFGKGVSGYIVQQDSHGKEFRIKVALGNRTFMRSLGYTLPGHLLAERERRTDEGQMGSFLALNDEVIGLLLLQDIPREHIETLVPSLKQMGIQETVLLTGDSEKIAKQVGALSHVDQIVAQCLPETKVSKIEELKQQKQKVLMIGDGVNDAPALVAATVGIALGSQGLTVASESADAVLLSTDILKVADVVRLGRSTRQIALQGIWLGMGLSILAMIIASFGGISPTFGAILQEGIDVLVIFNALRVHFFVKAVA